MEEKVQFVYNFIQERCLWQFFSRNWDRERNIKCILQNVASLYSGEDVPKETNLDKCYYADAKILLQQLQEQYSWFAELTAKDVKQICDTVTEKLIDIAVTNSLNAERTLEYY